MDSILEGKSLWCAPQEHIPSLILAFPLWDKPICLVGVPVGEGNYCWTVPDLGTGSLVLVLVLCASML